MHQIFELKFLNFRKYNVRYIVCWSQNTASKIIYYTIPFFSVPTNISITGNFNGVQGSDVLLFCNYTVSLPFGEQTTFFVGDQKIFIPTVRQFSIVL